MNLEPRSLFIACSDPSLSATSVTGWAALGEDVEGMGHDTVKDALINEIGALRERAGLNKTLGSLGITPEAIPELAQNAAADPCAITNPRSAEIKDIEGIYAKAL